MTVSKRIARLMPNDNEDNKKELAYTTRKTRAGGNSLPKKDHKQIG